MSKYELLDYYSRKDYEILSPYQMTEEDENGHREVEMSRGHPVVEQRYDLLESIAYNSNPNDAGILEPQVIYLLALRLRTISRMLNLPPLNIGGGQG